MSALTVLVTGGLGFVGSNVVRLLRAERPDWRVVVLDALTYAGHRSTLGDLSEGSGLRVVIGDIADAPAMEALFAEERPRAVLNLAAESHVDRSTSEKAGAFIETNVYGTFVLLEAMRLTRPGARFLQIGTDEVYGDVAAPASPDETAMLAPSSPYSASKAGADHLALSFARTHGLDVMVSRCTNNYGPYQYPEKLIPLFVTNALDDEPLPLYDGGTQIRDWLRVEDHCDALLLLLATGLPGEIYNVGANQEPERTNAEVTEMILSCTGKPDSLVEHRHGLRPGHDQRYAVATDKLRALGWSPQAGLEAGIEQTVRWYAENRDWWEPLKSGEYRRFYEAHYGRRGAGEGAARG